ncbi:MAG: 2Fe-2S iron-sulfur cluster binding domain-containing protein [Hyphomonadaceae bacterium]|nr:2Fe-2S iron-sulfur cluster binding domain-containing protein [Hyphomonadaceae bacterium]
MTKILVTTRDGKEHVIEAKQGFSVMEALRHAGIDEVLAICGGSLSCATCHVYVDPAFAALTGAKSPEEVEMLDFAEHARDESRLSCQIRVTPELDGLKITVAPE